MAVFKMLDIKWQFVSCIIKTLSLKVPPQRLSLAFIIKSQRGSIKRLMYIFQGFCFRLISTQLKWWSFLLFLGLSAHATSENIYTHFQKQVRFPYEVKLFKMAIERLGLEVKLKELPEEINYGRGMKHLEKGIVDFAFFATNDELEKRFLPVKLPILNGILGLRLNLVHKDSMHAFKYIETLDDIIKRFNAGFNNHWPDHIVLIENNMPTVFHASYKSLFTMLENKRFDYFPRGINEVWTEQEANTDHAPNIIVDQHIAFFYPYPVYFFVNKANVKLAERIEKGLVLMLYDGSFKKWFLAYHQKFLERAKIDKRKIIFLKNPNLPSDFNYQHFDTSWWMPEELKLK
ncbi:hypothetical protein H0A36_06260 [Endozoicomonas sp. SM1973]|uniref:Solute-binding protein family 3/N-terminal domain-containing protein n=1 Tax=Spartinivicinus marinus TaxID=2994442 RepID=A0A853HZ12_9GAMM|nr:hypothetical protein [Spartinivicinus marinus]MCX4028274.1 hypothetical protein [Spartinivicinus marinus]NYZ65609.1 hypothetical protein [Spartinivicinus marinus]